MNTISQRLETARKHQGLTYKKLGDLVGITESGMRLSIKRNNVKEYYINIISDKTKINKDWLLTGKGEMIKEETPSNLSVNNIAGIINFLLDNNEYLLKNETFQNYIKMSYEMIETDELKRERDRLEAELKEKIRKKLKNKNF